MTDHSYLFQFNKQYLRSFIWIHLLLLLSACSIEIKDVQLPNPFLTNASVYTISGKNIAFDDKQLNFGPYTTLAISRGGVGKTSSNIVLRKERISQKIDFTMVDGSGLRADARAEGVLAEGDTSILDRWLRNEWWYQGNRNYKNYFAGGINIEGVGLYEFLIQDAYSSQGRKEANLSGALIAEDNGDNHQYEIATYRPKTDGLVLLQNTHAYIVRKGGTIIGAMQEAHPEKIWISDLVSEKDRFIVANVFGLLILRQDLIID